MPFDKKQLQERMSYLWKTDMPLCLMINEAMGEIERLAVARPTGSGAGLLKYQRKPGNEVQAIQLMPGAMLTYKSWGGLQSAIGGDWLVRRKDGETYTVEQKSFAATYSNVIAGEQLSVGWYDKHAPVWATVAPAGGEMETKEGKSAYAAGDYLCYNSADRTDGWPMPPAKFESLYELIVEHPPTTGAPEAGRCAPCVSDYDRWHANKNS